ncbi:MULTISPECIES: hypothetical protein, partial [unclassified Microcoleus]
MENLSIRCGRPAFRYCAGRLGFWVFLAQKQGENIMAQEFLPNSDDSDRPNDRKTRRKPLALDTGKSRQRFQPPSF